MKIDSKTFVSLFGDESSTSQLRSETEEEVNDSTALICSEGAINQLLG
jgi:hypothetical protein